MVRATVPDVGNHVVEGVPDNKGKGEKMVLEPPMNSAQRRKLGDITNLPKQKKLLNQGANQQQQALLLSSKENAEKLHKDNIALTKVLRERNKTIELSDVALQKLRINLQKVQEQNLQLAKTNNNMLADLNTSKDQLKVLQHELSCKNGLLIAKKILLKDQTLPSTRHTSEDKARENAPGRACKTFQPNGPDHKNALESSNVNSVQLNEKANNKRSSLSLAQPAKSKFLETGETENLQEVVDTKEIKENARVSLRNRSARLNDQEPELSESFHESIQTTKRQRRVSSRKQSPKVEESTDPPLQDDIVESSQISSSVSMETNRESKEKPRGEEAEVMRRPTRQAAEKIQSYREASLKEKMRRNF